MAKLTNVPRNRKMRFATAITPMTIQSVVKFGACFTYVLCLARGAFKKVNSIACLTVIVAADLESEVARGAIDLCSGHHLFAC
jgi:hypothetical protein